MDNNPYRNLIGWRRIFRFRLRTLLIVFAVIAAPLGWIGKKCHEAQQQRAIVDSIWRWGDEVYVHYAIHPDLVYPGLGWNSPVFGPDFFNHVRFVFVTGRAENDPRSVGDILKEMRGLPELGMLRLAAVGMRDADLAYLPKLYCMHVPGNELTDAGIRDLISHDGITEIDLSGNKITDAALAQIGALTKMQYLGLIATRITGDGLAKLSSLNDVVFLYLGNNDIGDNGIQHLAQMKKLQHLDVSNTAITDRSLELLLSFPNLQKLDLSGTEITDAGLEYIAGLPKLSAVLELDLKVTSVTREGIRRLELAQPDITLLHDFEHESNEDNAAKDGVETLDQP